MSDHSTAPNFTVMPAAKTEHISASPPCAPVPRASQSGRCLCWRMQVSTVHPHTADSPRQPGPAAHPFSLHRRPSTAFLRCTRAFVNVNVSKAWLRLLPACAGGAGVSACAPWLSMNQTWSSGVRMDHRRSCAPGRLFDRSAGSFRLKPRSCGRRSPFVVRCALCGASALSLGSSSAAASSSCIVMTCQDGCGTAFHTLRRCDT